VTPAGADFWWRDDDAARRSEAFDRCCRLRSKRECAGLAVIPERAEPELFEGLSAQVKSCSTATIIAIVREREKPSEFPPTEAIRFSFGPA